MTLRITCLSKVVTLLVILLHYFDVGNIPSTVKPPQQQASLIVTSVQKHALLRNPVSVVQSGFMLPVEA